MSISLHLTRALARLALEQIALEIENQSVPADHFPRHFQCTRFELYEAFIDHGIAVPEALLDAVSLTLDNRQARAQGVIRAEDEPHARHPACAGGPDDPIPVEGKLALARVILDEGADNETSNDPTLTSMLYAPGWRALVHGITAAPEPRLAYDPDNRDDE